MNPKLKNLLYRYAPVPAAWLARTWMRLVRTRLVGLEEALRLGQLNAAHWHGDDLCMLPKFGTLHPAVLVSRSRDGEFLAKGTAYLGYHVVRGSSSRGAVAGMMALIKASRQGFHTTLAVDGPQGPRHVCKPGVVRLTQKTGVPLVPIGVAASRVFVFKRSWNKTFLPLPFSRLVIFIDRPVVLGSEKDPQALEAYCRQVEAALHKAHDKAEQILAHF